MKISFKTENNYLREIYGRPKKFKKRKGSIFAKKYYKRVLISAFNAYRWVSNWFRRIYQRLVQTSLRFITKIEKRKSRGLWWRGGISYFGLINIIFIEGTMNDFFYGQTIIYYKEDIQKINRENNTTLIF